MPSAASDLDREPDAGRAPALDLASFVTRVSAVRSFEDLTRLTTQAVRDLMGADGATFVLRDGERCFYVDEDAISPLWKGSRFPLNTCISGWAMLNREAAAICDIYQDARIPIDAYRPTFVRSLIMAPVGRDAPTAALGAYWSETRQLTDAEVERLQAIADATAMAVAYLRLQASPSGPAAPGASGPAPALETRLPDLVERTRRGLGPESLAAYGLALGLVGVAALVRAILSAVGGPGIAPFATYFLAVLLSKLLGGGRPAVLAAVASAAVAAATPVWLGEPLSTMTAPSHLLNSGLFLATSMLMIWALTRYRRALFRLLEEEALHAGVAREIQHRMRNALSVVQTIVNHSLRADAAQAEILNQRIWAGVSDLTLGDASPGASLDLRALLRRSLEGFDPERFDLSGQDTPVAHANQVALALTVHELATNAAKYGALSGPSGRVSVSWTRRGARQVIEWREQGGPRVRPPARRGYGSVFLARLLRASGGEFRVDYPADGLTARIALAIEPAAAAS